VGGFSTRLNKIKNLGKNALKVDVDLKDLESEDSRGKK